MAQKRKPQSEGKPAGGRRSDRLDRNAWIDAALEILARPDVASADIDSVGVEPLAKGLGVTKGSFYWHFKDRAALLQAVLRKWQQRATLEVIQRVEHSHKPAAERIGQLIELTYSSPVARKMGLVEQAIRRWSHRDGMAAAALAEVDDQRLRYLVGLFRSAGCRDDEAQARGFLVYAYNFGEAAIYTDEDPERRKKRRELCKRILLGL